MWFFWFVLCKSAAIAAAEAFTMWNPYNFIQPNKQTKKNQIHTYRKPKCNSLALRWAKSRETHTAQRESSCRWRNVIIFWRMAFWTVSCIRQPIKTYASNEQELLHIHKWDLESIFVLWIIRCNHSFFSRIQEKKTTTISETYSSKCHIVCWQVERKSWNSCQKSESLCLFSYPSAKCISVCECISNDSVEKLVLEYVSLSSRHHRSNSIQLHVLRTISQLVILCAPMAVSSISNHRPLNGWKSMEIENETSEMKTLTR